VSEGEVIVNAIVWLVTLALSPITHTAEATVFDVSRLDPGNPDDSLACVPGYRLRADQPIIASYTLPCGSLVEVTDTRTGRSIIAPVLDRGPRRARRPERADDIDLSAAAARMLGWGANSRGVVEWRRL
jgi:hypothetical protein